MLELEQAFGVTARLREVRDTMKEFLGDGYDSRCRDWQEVLRSQMRTHGCSALLAATRIINADFPDNGSAQAMLVSAAVELTEAGVGPENA